MAKEKFTKQVVDEDTEQIEHEKLIVLEYLFRNYTKASSDEVKQKESEVLSTLFNPSYPMVLIYRPRAASETNNYS